MANLIEQTAAIDTSYLNELNEQQRAAVIHTEGPSLVVAGAGSGKTKVLTTKIAYLLKEKRATASQILALTFTNKAAAEMRHRIECMIGKNVQAVWLGTFHSIFIRLLRLEANSLGYPTYFSVYDADDSKSLLKQIIKELDLSDQIYKPALLLSRISHAKNRLVTAAMYNDNPHYKEEDARMHLPRFGEIFARYTHYCQRAGAMDFDDLLTQTHTMLYTNPTVCAKYQQQFRYLLIDEFQDTNLIQYQIIQKLAAQHHNICVVGDDAQSIYAFRGADIQNILNFTRDYPHHHITKLEQNYRSTQHIVTAANHIISHNTTQLKKKVWTTNKLGEPIKIIKARSDLEESQWIVQAILETKLHNLALYQDFAILYRTNSQSRNFEEALRKKNIPYRMVGGFSFFQRKEIKELLAYLRFVVNHNDTEAFKKIINLPKRGIGLSTLEKIGTLTNEKKLPLWELLGKAEDFFRAPTAEAILRFVAFIKAASLKLTTAEENAYTIANYIAKESGLLRQLYEDQTVEGLARYEHIQELLSSLKQFVDNHNNEDNSLASFLQTVALMTQEYEDDTSKDKVTLMTIHAAKGLEFKYIYMVGMEEGLFPSARMLGNQEELEEERRLFYVAVTRAQLQLTLSYALSRYQFGKLMAMRPSRFLKEISLEESTASSNKIATAATQRTAAATQFMPCSNETTLRVGHMVRHTHFGKGLIIQLLATEGKRKAVIRFSNNVGEKTLLLNYAKLELLI
ncbi:MAG: exodeoxyribonuclease V subunit gamma [Candidatus Cardinium sp.]|nr:exodeoxyribonuclease V subunit gamma [Candidatus Cardinium sp.]